MSLFRKKTHFVYKWICLPIFHKLDEILKILCVCYLFIRSTLVYMFMFSYRFQKKLLISTNNNKWTELKLDSITLSI